MGRRYVRNVEIGVRLSVDPLRTNGGPIRLDKSPTGTKGRHRARMQRTHRVKHASGQLGIIGHVRHGRRLPCLGSVCGFESRRAREASYRGIIQRLGCPSPKRITSVRVRVPLPYLSLLCIGGRWAPWTHRCRFESDQSDKMNV